MIDRVARYGVDIPTWICYDAVIHSHARLDVCTVQGHFLFQLK